MVQTYCRFLKFDQHYIEQYGGGKFVVYSPDDVYLYDTHELKEKFGDDIIDKVPKFVPVIQDVSVPGDDSKSQHLINAIDLLTWSNEEQRSLNSIKLCFENYNIWINKSSDESYEYNAPHCRTIIFRNKYDVINFFYGEINQIVFIDRETPSHIRDPDGHPYSETILT
jgi:hypothetical protein